MEENSTARVGLFVDASGIAPTSRAWANNLHFRRLVDIFKDGGRIASAFYYTTATNDGDVAPLSSLMDRLGCEGRPVITKRIDQRHDAAARPASQGRVEIELAMDVIEMASQLDHIVLLPGDSSNVTPLVDAVQRRGVRVTVLSASGMSTKEGAGHRTARDAWPSAPCRNSKANAGATLP